MSSERLGVWKSLEVEKRERERDLGKGHGLGALECFEGFFPGFLVLGEAFYWFFLSAGDVSKSKSGNHKTSSVKCWTYIVVGLRSFLPRKIRC